MCDDWWIWSQNKTSFLLLYDVYKYTYTTWPTFGHTAGFCVRNKERQRFARSRARAWANNELNFIGKVASTTARATFGHFRQWRARENKSLTYTNVVVRTLSHYFTARQWHRYTNTLIACSSMYRFCFAISRQCDADREMDGFLRNHQFSIKLREIVQFLPTTTSTWTHWTDRNKNNTFLSPLRCRVR